MSDRPVEKDPPPGASYITFEPPDMGFIRFIGPVSAEDVRRVREEERKFARGRRYLLLLVDLSQAGSVGLEARVTAVRDAEDLPIRGISVFGATFQSRVLANLVMSAISTLYRNRDTTAAFFATEAEARLWIKRRREALEQQMAQVQP